MNDWSDEVTDHPLYADRGNYYKVEKWSRVLAINVILKAAMASPPQIARASCTLSSTALAAMEKGSCGRVLTQGSLMHSADNGGIRAVLRSAIRALGMQKDQCPKGRTILPRRSERQASERPPCCHKVSVAAYQ
jgi:hypothetical protein